jgi:hypothetical protein
LAEADQRSLAEGVEADRRGPVEADRRGPVEVAEAGQRSALGALEVAWRSVRVAKADWRARADGSARVDEGLLADLGTILNGIDHAWGDVCCHHYRCCCCCCCHCRQNPRVLGAFCAVSANFSSLLYH